MRLIWSDLFVVVEGDFYEMKELEKFPSGTKWWIIYSKSEASMSVWLIVCWVVEDRLQSVEILQEK